MSNQEHNGQRPATAPGSTILHIPQAQSVQPQPTAQPMPQVQTAPVGARPQAVPQAAPQPQVQVVPVGQPPALYQPTQPQAPQGQNPLAGVTKLVQDNKRELLFAGAGAFLATMIANGNMPRFPGRGGGRT